MQYYNTTRERIKGEIIAQRTLVRLNRKPFKVYLFQEKEDGSEILYNVNIDTKKAVINPGKFPYITLNLSPFGSIMRNNAHHTIFQADLLYTYSMLNYSIVNRKNDDLLKFHGKVKLEGKTLYKIELINKDYKTLKYSIKKGESINSIAQKKRIGSYKILELNPKYNFHNDGLDGDNIIIPNSYAKRIILYIDTKTYLPYIFKIYDEKGLYESYTFGELEINNNFPKAEFTKEYKGYNF